MKVGQTASLARRSFLRRAGAALVAIGGTVREGSPAFGAAARSSLLRQLPRLDGELAVDEASRHAVAGDYGRHVHRVPTAVLRPGSGCSAERQTSTRPITRP